MDKHLGETVDKLDEETIKIISRDNNKPIQCGRDISLPSTIMTYKAKLAISISNLQKQQKIINSNDTQSTKDSILITRDKSKISDLETNISSFGRVLNTTYIRLSISYNSEHRNYKNNGQFDSVDFCTNSDDYLKK